MTSAVEFKCQVNFVPLKKVVADERIDIHISLFVFIRCQQEEMLYYKILEKFYHECFL